MAVGPRSLRERKKARTREALIAAAIDLFESRGYEGTTIDDIAAAADVSPRTFFRYFASKEEVAVGDDFEPMLIEMIASRPAGESVIESARQVAVLGLALMSPEDWAALLARLKLVYKTAGAPRAPLGAPARAATPERCPARGSAWPAAR